MKLSDLKPVILVIIVYWPILYLSAPENVMRNMMFAIAAAYFWHVHFERDQDKSEKDKDDER